MGHANSLSISLATHSASFETASEGRGWTATALSPAVAGRVRGELRRLPHIQLAGTGLVCETWALEAAVIPAKAGIYSANLKKGALEGLDSRFRGNDWRSESDPILNDTTTNRQPPTGTSLFKRVRVNCNRAPVAQMDRAAAFEAEGRGFESLQARQLSSQASARSYQPSAFSRQLSALGYQSFFPTYERSRQ